MQYLLSVTSIQYPSNTIECYRGKNENSLKNFCKSYECYTLIHYTLYGIKLRRGCVNKRMEFTHYEKNQSYEIFYCKSFSYCNNATGDFSKLKSSSSASGKNYFTAFSWGMNIFNSIGEKLRKWFYS